MDRPREPPATRVALAAFSSCICSHLVSLAHRTSFNAQHLETLKKTTPLSSFIFSVPYPTAHIPHRLDDSHLDTQIAAMVGMSTGMLGEDGIHVDMNHLKSGEVNLGTSIMAVNFKDGVILGADSRTTTGAYIANRVTDKLTKVHDTIWCCRSGSAADTQAVADIVQYHLGMYGIMNNEAPTTQTAAALFQELCYDNKDMLRYVYKIHADTTNKLTDL